MHSLNGGDGGLTPPQKFPDFFAPGGRLTLVSGEPVISSNQTSKTIVYYTPDRHAYFPVVRNGIIKPVYCPEDLSLTLTDAHSANAIYDVFGIERNGKGCIVTAPAWATATAGSGSRGSGGGSTELTRAGGLLVNRWGIPGLNTDAATFIQPMEGTYLGSLSIDASPGQVTCHVSYGQNRKYGVWNAYNRRRIVLLCGDTTSSWSYNTTVSTRPANNTSNNKLTTFMGLADQSADILYTQTLQYNNNAVSNQANWMAGIGINSTSSASGAGGNFGFLGLGSATYVPKMCSNSIATLTAAQVLGLNNVTALESTSLSGGQSVIWTGGAGDMMLKAAYFG